MKFKILISLIYFIIVINTNVHCSDFENLSYGQDVLSGRVAPTDKPIETTTKKSGFFGGIKKLFGGGKKTTTTPEPIEKNELSSSTTVKPSVSSTTPSQGKSNQNRDLVAPTPSSPKANSNNFDKNVGFGGISTSSTTSTTTVKPDNKRNFVAPVRPSTPTNIAGNAGIGINSNLLSSTTSKPDNKRDFIASPRPSSPGLPNNVPGTSTTTITPNNRRDYVAPTRSSSFPIVTPSSSRPESINFPVSPTPSSNRRDYVNPNIPVIPSRPPLTPTQSPPLPSRPSSPNLSDDKDFPALGPPRGHKTPTNKPSSGGPGDRVSFVPHKPGTPGTSGTTTKNQLAKDDELSTLTESLLTKDINNQNENVVVNLQGKTKSTDRTDEAPDKLLEVKDEALESPTIAKMRLLFNNYEEDISINEYVTPIEHKEENDFMDAVMATTVMRTAMQFLQKKGIVTPDPKTHRDYVKTLWFTLYSRGGGRIGSSAFEHVFLNEVKNGTVIGMHNWVYYAEEEKLGHADYKGYIRKVDLGNKGAILKYRFNYNGLEKYANTLFIGTSPELEMALYTICFAVRADQDCPISLNENKINIVTHTWKYRGKQLIGSAYPEI